MPPAGWGQPTARSGVRVKYVVIAVFAVIVIVAGLFVVLNLTSPAGHVYFSKSAYDQSSSTCQFGAPVTSVSTTDILYMIAAFNDTLDVSDTYSLDVVKDGAPLGAPTNATAETKFNCYIEQNVMGPLPAGVYKFTFKHNDKIEAEGTLTVKSPPFGICGPVRFAVGRAESCSRRAPAPEGRPAPQNRGDCDRESQAEADGM